MLVSASLKIILELNILIHFNNNDKLCRDISITLKYIRRKEKAQTMFRVELWKYFYEWSVSSFESQLVDSELFFHEKELIRYCTIIRIYFLIKCFEQTHLEDCQTSKWSFWEK